MTNQFQRAVQGSGRKLVDFVRRLAGLRTIVAVRPDSAWLEKVEALWEKRQGAFGPSPVRALRVHAEMGTLLAAVEGGTLLGFMAVKVNGQSRAAITHLVVNPAGRPGGVAKLLLDRAHVQPMPTLVERAPLFDFRRAAPVRVVSRRG
jgi:ribosomal protein S18 acetylase RimI-like enzyme